MNEEEVAKLLKKRGFVIQELIATEQSYVNKLKTCIDVYIEPLRTGEIIEKLDISSQFLNWEIIYGLHVELLKQLSDLELSKERVGGIFLTFVPFFKMYMQYLSNFEHALTRRAQLLTANSSFAAFIDKATKDPRCMGEGIESFLVAPVQRIPRYQLLLEQILKYTQKDHPDYNNVQVSLNKVIEVAVANNEAIKLREMKERIMRVMMSIEASSRVNLLDDPKRAFRREAELNKQCR